MVNKIDKKLLDLLVSDEQVADVANRYCIEPARLKAVEKVESNGEGFYVRFIEGPNGTAIRGAAHGHIKVRLESHHFGNFLDKKFPSNKFREEYPHLVSVNNYRIGGRLVRAGQAEFLRFIQACELDLQSALLATSFGRYQIMGFNYHILGYKHVEEMFSDFYKGEYVQLEGFIKFCQNKKILDNLQRGDMDEFFLRYNGRDYKANGYPEKFNRFYNQFKNTM